MASINSFLRDNVGAVSEKRVLVAPNIAESKLTAAIKAFGFPGNPESVVALFDNTLLGSGKDGLLFSGKRAIYRPTFSDPIEISYADIAAAEYKETPTGKNGDKIVRTVEVSLKEGGSVSIKDMIDCDYRCLATLLQSCAMNFDEYEEVRQLIPVEEMSDALKVAYVKTIINMAFAADGAADDKEFAEILLLMTRLNLSPDAQFELKAYLSSGESLASVESLLATINAECPEGQVRPVHVSLAKNLINTHLRTGGADLGDFRFFADNRHLFDVSDGELAVAVKTMSAAGITSGLVKAAKSTARRISESIDVVSGVKLLESVQEMIALQEKYNDVLAGKLEDALMRIEILEQVIRSGK